MSAQRISKLRQFLKKENLDAIIISNADHVRYLSGYTGSNGLLVVDHRQAHFFTDFRYVTQSKTEVKGARISFPGRSLAVGLKNVPSLHRRYATIGYECDYTTIAQRQEFAQNLNGSLLAPTRGVVEALSMVKDRGELALIEKAVKITDAAFAHALTFVKPGVREMELAAELEYFMKLNGASGPAFETIIASGARSALPHGVATHKKVAKGDFITFDFGAKYNGYVSDMTRTVVVGKASARQKKIYSLVLKAQKAAISRIKSGRPAAEVDKAARAVISKAGHGKRFGHGTGHGIGYYVHVGPRVAETSQDILRSGMVITIEPGVYIPDWGGVRIEDDVVVTANGGRILNKSPKDLLEL
ncbi:MAG TPA: aminopeptidase P family protein [candidate division Zixibacteria bacterium]|nr:aminopeptidase P family protein [candidate division Zixibacteria bacterium]